MESYQYFWEAAALLTLLPGSVGMHPAMDGDPEFPTSGGEPEFPNREVTAPSTRAADL